MIAEHYVRKWHAAGLIDAGTTERIVAWEAGHRRPVWLWAVAGTGALAISLGVMAIVGANWESVPDWLKLAVDVALNAICAALLFVFWRTERVWPREIAALLLFGLVLSGISLIGQVYQLQSEPWHALALWVVLCTPFLALVTRTRVVAVLWAIAFGTTWFVADEAIYRALGRLGALMMKPGHWDMSYAPALMTWLPACALIVMAEIRRLWLPARAQADVLLTLGATGLMASSSLAIAFDWQGDSGSLGPILAAMTGGLVAAGALWPMRRSDDGRMAIALVAVSVAAWLLGLALTTGQDWLGEVGRAVLFIAYWAAIGAIAARMGWRGLFGTAFTIVGLRLLFLYFEAIGGLTATGFSLLGGGILCLLLAAAGWRLMRGMRRTP